MNCPSLPSAFLYLPLVVVASILSQPAFAQQHDEAIGKLSSFVENYCHDCHNEDDNAGGLDLTTFDSSTANSDTAWDTSTWERMTKRLRGRQMPPTTADRPDEAEYRETITAFQQILDSTAQKFPNPGRTDAIRRLNRTEYRNAVRDLLGVEIEVDDLLPADQIGHGFDNVTVGELSPILLSRYIAAAEKISRIAVGSQQRSPGGVTIRLPADRTQESHVAGLPLGTRGGTLLKHNFPADGEYEIQLRLMRDRDENVEGLHEDHDIDVLVDRKPVHRFTVKPPGKEKNWQKRDDTLVDAHLKKRFTVTAGPHAVGVTFPKKFSSLLENRRQPFHPSFNRHRHPRRTPAIYEVSIVGPFSAQGPGDTPSRRKIFGESRTDLSDQPPETARRILASLVRKAYRRPATNADLDVPMQFFKNRHEADGFEAGIEAAVSTILVNPHFLFRAEAERPESADAGKPYQISDIELASRLSFFLWSSIPDEELLDLAERNQLHESSVLESQVERMLKDERSQSLVNNFAAQWLYLRNLESFKPDRRLFPDFDDNLRHAMRRETELLFERVVREDRNVLDIIRSDTTFLNERLARHYDIPGVQGSHFRPVNTSPSNEAKPGTQSANARGGLLRHASILAVTSYATRTSPTVRGNWILENILGTPAPPPPPNVPSLKEKTVNAAVSIRERLAEHRANPACASCHDLMDPIGFALENYDSVGRWRIFDQGDAIDSSGTLPSGEEISGLADLESGIMSQPESFAGTLTEKLLTFALGRGIEPYDGPAIRKVVRRAADNEFRFSSLIQGIVASTPFQMRDSQAGAEHVQH